MEIEEEIKRLNKALDKEILETETINEEEVMYNFERYIDKDLENEFDKTLLIDKLINRIEFSRDKTISISLNYTNRSVFFDINDPSSISNTLCAPNLLKLPKILYLLKYNKKGVFVL